jgi:regulatory protein
MPRPAPPRITAAYLENAALHYLERFASSSANLRRVLMRKAERSLAHHGGERDAAASLVDGVIAKLAGLGYLDDRAYAQAKAAGLHRRGKAAGAIRAALAAKGIDADTTADAVLPLDDLAAAVNLARRKKLGPFRADTLRTAMRERDLATLGRAGFPYEIARQVVEAADAEELDELSTRTVV